MRRVLPPDLASEIGRLDPSAIAEVRADAWPDVRDADELHDALLTLVAVPESETRIGGWHPPRQQARFRKPRALHSRMARLLRGIGRAAARHARDCTRGRSYWVCCRKSHSSFGRFSPARSSRALARGRRGRRFARRRALRVAQRLDGPCRAHDGGRAEPSPRPARRRNRQSAAAPGSQRLDSARAIHRLKRRSRSQPEPNGASAACSRAFTA